ncbi:collagen alpha-1(I) chain-like isoform X4 [Passer montanus]|uniref:collagen alpha-1(I) chain-like isoform X4 n=1 Tax=Passer montanus TaxID=9160 RepID=UPI001961E0D8|nr:collagen alpha-1(I) chain-like isoform X4 [Passer montanus]
MAMGHKRGQPGETPANSQKPPPGFRAPGPVGATALPCPVPEVRGCRSEVSVGTAGRPGGHRHRRGGGNGALPQLLPSGTRPAAPQGCVAELPPRPDPAPSLTRNGNGALGRPQIPEIPAGAAQELPWAGIPCPGTRERLFGVCCDPSPVGSLGCQLLVPSWMGTLSVTAPPGPPRARGSDKDVSAALPPPGPGTRPSTGAGTNGRSEGRRRGAPRCRAGAGPAPLGGDVAPGAVLGTFGDIRGPAAGAAFADANGERCKISAQRRLCVPGGLRASIFRLPSGV